MVNKEKGMYNQQIDHTYLGDTYLVHIYINSFFPLICHERNYHKHGKGKNFRIP